MDTCKQLMEEFGIGWFFNSKPTGLDVYSEIGKRTGLEDTCVFKSGFGRYVNINVQDLHTDVYSFMLFVQEQSVSAEGNVILSSAEENIKLTILDGYLKVFYFGTSVELQVPKAGTTFMVYVGVKGNTLILSVYSKEGHSVTNCLIEKQIVSFGNILLGNSGIYVSGFVFNGEILTKDEILEYYFKGEIKGPTMWFKLDDGIGDIVYDSCFRFNGIVDGMSATDQWCTTQTGFHNWKNKVGFVKSIYDITLPLGWDNKNKLTGLVQEVNLGTCKEHIRIVDIACIELTGTEKGDVVLDKTYTLNGTFLEFGFEGTPTGTLISTSCFEIKEDNGVLCLFVDGELLVHLETGYYKMYFDNGVVYVIRNGEQYYTAEYVDATINEEVYLLYNGVDNNLDTCVVSNVSFNVFTDTWDNYTTLFDYLFYKSEKGYIYDISGKGNSLKITEGELQVGRQNVSHKLLNGFTTFRTNGKGELVPNDLRNNVQILDVYEKQNYSISTRYGLPIIDAWLDMNPENKNTGFWTYFWDKSNTDVWQNLNGDYYRDTNYKWHIKELENKNILGILKKEYWNYLFINTEMDNSGVVIGLYDLVLFNRGSNIEPKQIVY